jgi:hypothetical protein
MDDKDPWEALPGSDIEDADVIVFVGEGMLHDAGVIAQEAEERHLAVTGEPLSDPDVPW